MNCAAVGGGGQDVSSKSPKFQSKAERVRFAIRKKYIVEENWTNKEIAQELGVSPEVVSRYLNQTPQAEEVQKAREALEKEEWKQLVTDLKRRIDKLAELERQLWDVVEPAVTAYDFVPVEAEISDFHLQDGGNSVALELDENDRQEVDVEVPVPDQWQEIPAFSRLKSVWDERRRTEEQLAKLLGLEADETLNLDGSITERKVFQVDDDYPDAQPHAKGEDPQEDHGDGNGPDNDPNPGSEDNVTGDPPNPDSDTNNQTERERSQESPTGPPVGSGEGAQESRESPESGSESVSGDIEGEGKGRPEKSPESARESPERNTDGSGDDA
jgi:predicted transcriptional regulator